MEAARQVERLAAPLCVVGCGAWRGESGGAGFGCPPRWPVVKNSGWATLHRQFGGLGTDRIDKSPGKSGVVNGNGPNDVDQPDFLTTKVLVWRGTEIT